MMLNQSNITDYLQHSIILSLICLVMGSSLTHDNTGSNVMVCPDITLAVKTLRGSIPFRYLCSMDNKESAETKTLASKLLQSRGCN